jgi:hypothetical protein
MKQIIKITIRWWHDEYDRVKPEHRNMLLEHSEEHIHKMRNDGYTSGELNKEIEGIYYNGYWEIQIKGR